MCLFAQLHSPIQAAQSVTLAWDPSVRRLRENGSFWLREINHLQILEQARSLSRKQIVHELW